MNTQSLFASVKTSLCHTRESPWRGQPVTLKSQTTGSQQVAISCLLISVRNPKEFAGIGTIAEFPVQRWLVVVWLAVVSSADGLYAVCVLSVYF